MKGLELCRRYYEQVGFIKIKRDDKGYRYFDDMQKILE